MVRTNWALWIGGASIVWAGLVGWVGKRMVGWAALGEVRLRRVWLHWVGFGMWLVVRASSLVAQPPRQRAGRRNWTRSCGVANYLPFNYLSLVWWWDLTLVWWDTFGIYTGALNLATFFLDFLRFSWIFLGKIFLDFSWQNFSWVAFFQLGFGDQ